MLDFWSSWVQDLASIVIEGWLNLDDLDGFEIRSGQQRNLFVNLQFENRLIERVARLLQLVIAVKHIRDLNQVDNFGIDVNVDLLDVGT